MNAIKIDVKPARMESSPSDGPMERCSIIDTGAGKRACFKNNFQ